ncbi:hypothetical protein [Leptospira sp. GIMC2001]|uniref:hypothetical protein n=1 Tax=Leptospira sp. GIMC2001 TaxID=1513297 RepID=UPI0023495976|nr:hypothetical protein [Leptospira sp. GIMC2001]WCL51501.1 hypothetical protein O4O04_20000 [Leptospira sp. GIMC2001]
MDKNKLITEWVNYRTTKCKINYEDWLELQLTEEKLAHAETKKRLDELQVLYNNSFRYTAFILKYVTLSPFKERNNRIDKAVIKSVYLLKELFERKTK